MEILNIKTQYILFLLNDQSLVIVSRKWNKGGLQYICVCVWVCKLVCRWVDYECLFTGGMGGNGIVKTVLNKSIKEKEKGGKKLYNWRKKKRKRRKNMKGEKKI